MRQIPSSKRYQSAFRAIETKIPPKCRAMLEAHYRAPGHKLTTAQLAKAVGYKSWEGAVLQYGLLAKRLCKLLSFDPPTYGDGTPLWTYVLADVPDERTSEHWQWVMRPGVVQALTDLSWFDDGLGRDNVLVLWEWAGAEDAEGYEMDNSVGSQIIHREKGDRLFICATRDNELFLLGAMDVNSVRAERNTGSEGHRREYRAFCTNISGRFQVIPLRADKWKLRFLSESDRLLKQVRIASQVQTHRILTAGSAKLLLQILRSRQKRQAELKPVFEREGRLMQKLLPVRERNPKVRRAAMEKYGRACMVCGFDFGAAYGEWAEDCVEVHHLHLVADAPNKGRKVSLADVIVVCPNCHRALHRSPNAADWRWLRNQMED